MGEQNLFQYLATTLFVIALFHIFFASQISKIGSTFKEGSVAENFFHLFGEVEIVFGFWSAILVLLSMFFLDFQFIMSYLNQRNFTEPFFVFVIMTVCSTKPVVDLAENLIIRLSELSPISKNLSTYFIILVIGPLMGSLITEPAAMTICALLLLPRFFTKEHSLKFKYATLSLLFVNVSIGGTLTPFAAPPVLMVAQKWNWDLAFMLQNFAPKTILTVIITTLLVTYFFKKEISRMHYEVKKNKQLMAPLPVSLVHLFFLFLIVLTAHYTVLFFGIFLFFIGFLTATKEYQNALRLREPLLVAFFLAGLVVLGGAQQWWLEPLIAQLSHLQLYIGSIILTSFTDNAALTYLGTLIPHLDDAAKLALVKGSVIGGGLTLIANAPNPAGFGILGVAFAEKGFSPLRLFLWAFPLTLLASLLFYL